MKKITQLLIFCFAILLFVSCTDKEETGTVTIQFEHVVGGSIPGPMPLMLNELSYYNRADNLYQVNEVKYFISKMRLIGYEDNYFSIKQDRGIHYVDLIYPNTTTWELKDIPAGSYKAVQFVFGLDEEDNVSNSFPNPPECNFFWPEHLGGGYHYMQINGKWEIEPGTLKNFNFHTGIGQLYRNNVITIDSIFAYIHNYFVVTLPINFEVEKNQNSTLGLVMDINEWFQNPYVYDHNVYGTSIMQNQEAQQIIRENGRTVFGIYNK